MKPKKIDVHSVMSSKSCIIYHPPSISAFKVDAESAKVLELYEKGLELKAIGKKLAITEQEVSEIIDMVYNDIKQRKSYEFIDFSTRTPCVNPLSKLALLVSQSCNLSCRYCYADGGNYGLKKDLMPFEVAKAALLTLPKKIKGRINAIQFFGGEPLLNYRLIKKVCKFVTVENIGKNINYILVTNGTIVNKEIIDLLNSNPFSVVVSLDGKKDINDINRVSLKGFSVHDKVIKTLSLLNKNRNFKLSIECTITPEHIKQGIGFGDIIDYFGNQGIDGAYLIPVCAPVGNQFEFSPQDYEQLIVEYKKTIDHSINNYLSKNKSISNDYFKELISPFIVKYRATPFLCTAGTSSLTITAQGDIYPCYMLTGIEDLYMGNILDPNFPDSNYYEVMERLMKNTIKNCKPCNTCWARTICRSCYGRMHITNDTISRAHSQTCAVSKTLFDYVIFKLSELMLDPVKFNSLKSIENNIQKHSANINPYD
jgi:uncharacterized protein